MPRMQSRRQQTKRSNHWKIDTVFYRHQLRRRTLIYFRNHGFVARVELFNLRLLVNDLRFVIAHLVDLVSDLLEICSPDGYAEEFLAAELDFLAGITNSRCSNRFRRAPLIRKRIE